MLNYIILTSIAAALAVSCIAVMTERALPHQKHLRAVRNFMRGISLTGVITASAALLFIGLIGDDYNFRYIWCAVAMLFIMLCILLPPRLKNKKARKLNERSSCKFAEKAAVLPELPTAKEINDVRQE